MFGTYMVTWTSRLRKKKKRSGVDRSVREGAPETSSESQDHTCGVAIAEGSENLIPADQLPSAAATMAELFPPEETSAESSFRPIEPSFDTQLRTPLIAPLFRSSRVVTESSFEASVLAAFEAPAEPAVRESEEESHLAITDSCPPACESLAQATPESFMDTLAEVCASVSHGEMVGASVIEVIPTEIAPTVEQDETSTHVEAASANVVQTAVDVIFEHNSETMTEESCDLLVQPTAVTPVESARQIGAEESDPVDADDVTTSVSATDPSPVFDGTDEKVSMPFLSDPPAAAPAMSLCGTSGGEQTKQSDWAFEERLASHREWIESHGKSGKKVDLASAELEGTELISVNLRFADLRDANLRATDLLLADLRDACLMRANLQDACLVGANLEGANLEGASLETSMGLVPHQLAGTNLHEASLPQGILKFEAAADFERGSRAALRFFIATSSICLLSWLTIWRTRDIQLLVNLSIFPFLHSPASAGAVPTDQFYLIAPVVLFIVYLVFQFHLQRLWDSTLELPAVFPDGHALGEHTPRLVMGLLRAHFRWMNQEAASTRLIEKAGAMAAAYWLVPFTLFFYWARYLTLQDMHGTILQALLVAAASGVALYSTTRVGRPDEKWNAEPSRAQRIVEKLKRTNPAAVALGLAVFLVLVSAGTIAGVPHEKSRAPQYSAANVRRWGPSVLWSVGINPWANLNEAGISVAPADWTGSDDKLNLVKGARLDSPSFRYAEAYGAFLANAHLRHADLQGAFLSAADLRGADLGQSNLRFAVLDQAQMSHANLDRANLEGTNLGRADLRGANLSYCLLANAFLLDAHLEKAVLYQAQLSSATLARANLENADLRGARLEGANLDYADLQQSYLWSAKLAGAHLDNANLDSAIFIDSDLAGADLRGAKFRGTVLNGANLTGTDLDGADLRNVSGLSADQICSAKSRRWVLLGDALQVQVTTQCGAAH